MIRFNVDEYVDDKDTRLLAACCQMISDRAEYNGKRPPVGVTYGNDWNRFYYCPLCCIATFCLTSEAPLQCDKCGRDIVWIDVQE